MLTPQAHTFVVFVGIPYFRTMRKKLPHVHAHPETAKYCPECGKPLYAEVQLERDVQIKATCKFTIGDSRFIGSPVAELSFNALYEEDMVQLPDELFARIEAARRLFQNAGYGDEVAVYMTHKASFVEDYD